jgi:SagB-type dehydrogenase family enzyme
VELPVPRTTGSLTVEEAIRRRRSVREFATHPLRLESLAQLLWAAQGVTSRDGARAAPSAGALYPLEIVVAAGNVASLPPGLYRYHSGRHRLSLESAGDSRQALARAALDQQWIADAGAILVIGAVPGRTTRKYGDRGERYIHMEVGHAAQNLYLQAVALELGTAIVGAFDDEQVKAAARLRADEVALALVPVGPRLER